MFVCQVFVWFIVYSVVGWLWESTYCTCVERRWQNRGFLYGPVCPIYGTAIVGIMLLWRFALEQGTTLAWWQVFLTMALGSAVLEYATHWALEKLFHAYWWDYSNMPLNLNGRICLPATLFFGFGGLLVVYVLYEPTIRIVANVDPLVAEAAALVLMGAIAADTAVTAASLASISHAAVALNQSINDHMDRFVIDVQERSAAVAGELAERRDETAQTLQAAAASIRTRQEAFSHERERFARTLRKSQIGQMGGAVSSAARRAMGAVSPEKLPNLPEREQLVQLWRDMLER